MMRVSTGAIVATSLSPNWLRRDQENQVRGRRLIRSGGGAIGGPFEAEVKRFQGPGSIHYLPVRAGEWIFEDPAIRSMVTFLPTMCAIPGALAAIPPMAPQGIGGSSNPDFDDALVSLDVDASPHGRGSRTGRRHWCWALAPVPSFPQLPVPY
jgi:hypothetical protein